MVENEKEEKKGSWASKASERPIATGNFISIVNGLDYRMQFIDFYDESCQDKPVDKPKYKSPNETTVKYWYKVKLTRVGIANKAYAEVARQENEKKFENALSQAGAESYTLEIPPSASKALGAFAKENEEYLAGGGEFKMVRTGQFAKTKYIFSIPQKGNSKP